MKTVLTEKPAVAREIATVLGATQKREGYFEGNGYYVTWAYGHLIGLGMPEDYGVVGFVKEQLPVLPKPFKLVVRNIKQEKKFQNNWSKINQLKVLKSLFDKSNIIIAATDAGREGELIFRYIYDFLKCKKEFKRLWISSLTEKAIRDGFENLQEGSFFDGIYKAAKARSQSDWLVGINASQALSIALNNGNYSLGRVQTPTLTLICERFLKNKDFIADTYYQLELSLSKAFCNFYPISLTKWTHLADVNEVIQVVKRKGILVVTSTLEQEIVEQPPLLYDLTGLQKQANIQLNFTAEETLAIAQKLYENRFITYPRTGSKHIPEDLWPHIPSLIRSLQAYPSCSEVISNRKWNRWNKRIVDDLKVTDHHGILVTGKIPSALTSKEKVIYDLIAFRLLESIAEPCLKIKQTISFECLQHKFITRGITVTQAGWREIRGILEEDLANVLPELPDLTQGETLSIKEVKLLEKKTKAPELFTEAGILSAMETAAKNSNIQINESALKNIGLGTPATRASIIETLIARAFITREKKILLPTDKGLHVYELVKDLKIARVDLTLDWEISFHEMESGKLSEDLFYRDIESYTTSITKELLAISPNEQQILNVSCPKCKCEKVIFSERLVSCTNDSCKWYQFRWVCGIYLPLQQIDKLLLIGRTDIISDFISKNGKKFNARIVLNPDGKTNFEFS